MTIMHFTQIIFKENVTDVGLPPKLNLFFNELILQISCFFFLELLNCIHAYLKISIKKNEKRLPERKWHQNFLKQIFVDLNF